MADKVLHVQFNTETPERSLVWAHGPDTIIPCSTVTVELDPSLAAPNCTAMLMIRIPLRYGDFDVVHTEATP